MKEYLKRSIQNAYSAPPPDRERKERFLRTLPQQKISIVQFVFSQIAYMRKRTLVFSVLLLVSALIGAYQISENTLWMISSFMPFLGLLAVSESTCSIKYGMCEFEMSARFSLKSIVLARMCVLGILDLIIFCLLIPLCRIGQELWLFQTGLYLFVPYLLTVNGCLWFTRHFHGKENIYGCMCIAVLISGANEVLHWILKPIDYNTLFAAWMIAAIFLLADMVYEISCTLKETEELVWN